MERQTTAGGRTLNQVVAFWDPPKELVKVCIPPIARDRKARHRNITVIQLSQQRIVIRIIVLIVVTAVNGRRIIRLVILRSRRQRVVAGACGRRGQLQVVRVDR